MKFKNPREFANHLAAEAMDPLVESTPADRTAMIRLAARTIARLVAACDGDNRESDGRFVHNSPVSSN